MILCPHPDCSVELEGRNAFICSIHYFELSATDARILTRLKIKAGRNPAIRDHLESQLEFYIRDALKRNQSSKTKESNCVS